MSRNVQELLIVTKVVVELCFYDKFTVNNISVVSKRCLRLCSSLTRHEITRICHWSLMQTEKSQPEGKRIMAETRFTEFPALSVDPRVGISWSAPETDV